MKWWAAIKARVDAGSYASMSEVLRAAVWVWLREGEEYQQRIAAIRQKVKASLDDPRPNLSLQDVDAWIQTLGEEKQ